MTMRVERKRRLVLNASYNLMEEERTSLHRNDIYDFDIITLDDDFVSLEELALNDDICNTYYYLVRNLPKERELSFIAKSRIMGLHPYRNNTLIVE
ncbi:hypothetical protein EDC51_10464 [Bibersteinia trehalosi]|uniref:hypothetical protein n=1 Tax=Bibersteinia trehalosi TaxID=47735 RepID=UPI001044D88C|nr:hypothetical protein [Bibersteinia trehalosi]TCT16514.1 hypothetical protein EDC51_10464 [Bibersteinia trehalosi]